MRTIAIVLIAGLAACAPQNPGAPVGGSGQGAVIPDAKILRVLTDRKIPASARQPSCPGSDGTPLPEPVFSQEAMHSKQWGPQTIALYQRLSEGDRSVMQAALKQRRATMLTLKCSPNDLFWTQLVRIGLLEVTSDGVSPDASSFARGYRLPADRGKAEALVAMLNNIHRRARP